jgi:hypothetical protein
MKADPVLPNSVVEPRIAQLVRKLFRWLGVVAIAVLTIIALRDNLWPQNSAAPVDSSWMGNVSVLTVQYPSRWAQIMNLFYRLRLRRTGMQFPPGSQLSLDHVIGNYFDAMVPRPSSFTTYYSSGLNGASVSIVPITTTNAGRVSSVPATLETLLASNGFTVIRLKRNVIKVFPISMSSIYSNAPIRDPFPDDF